jgi:hypothetical protein
MEPNKEKLKTESRWRSVKRFAVLAAQLGLLLLVLRQFQIESNAFIRVCAVAFAGFGVHYFLPLRFKLPFFAMLSMAAIVVVFGPISSLWLVAVGMVLVGICHLPLPFVLRVVALLLAGALLAALRVDWFQAPWSSAIWPILGSMFMFRLMGYLYDGHHDKAPFSLARTFAYFFMLPNVCFPLFPVVDYKTFRRNYYDGDEFVIYQTGIEWMTRGVIHLILYRIVYYYYTIGPAEVASPSDLAQFMVTSFLLYLRISGQFHLIVGMLRLFGFNLLETHHLYYLAASFTDFWRRINIYWKDFMMKLFYYPLFFRLRNRGTTMAMVVATIFVFFVTWLLHAYQWFWLRGSILLTGPDMAFWGVLALLVIVNSLYELKYGRERKLATSSSGAGSVAKRVLKTAATFCVICILWSLWQSETLDEWFALWDVFRMGGGINAYNTGVFVGGGVVLGVIVFIAQTLFASGKSRFALLSRSTTGNCALLLVLSLIGIQEIYVRFGPTTATFVNTVRSGKLSRLDVAMLEKGYYENLNRVERFNSQLWELYMNRPATWLDTVGTGLERFTGDFLQKELVPSFVAFTSHGSVRTNRWGMRDKDYEKLIPPNTYRIAVLGASTVMGWGVGDDEVFEAVLERRLNEERNGKRSNRYEVLNFAVPGYRPPQQVMASQKALSFQPKTLFYVAAAREPSNAALYLAEVASKSIPVPYESLRAVLKKANVEPGLSEAIASRRLFPFRNEILEWTYQRIVALCREREVLPVLIFLPQVEDGAWREETPDILRIAKEAGFIVFDLSNVFHGQDITTLRLAESDNHPNAKGHQLVASLIYSLIQQQQDQLFPLRGKKDIAEGESKEWLQSKRSVKF